MAMVAADAQAAAKAILDTIPNIDYSNGEISSDQVLEIVAQAIASTITYIQSNAEVSGTTVGSPTTQTIQPLTTAVL